jgi:hypothetical protein
MNLETLTTNACHKAMKACVDHLLELGWAKQDIHEAADFILPRLRAEAKAILDKAVADLAEGLQTAARGYAPIAFNLEFVLAGNRVAREVNAGYKAAAAEHADRRLCTWGPQ